MDEAKVRGLMGLTVRAHHASFGEEGCLKAVRSGQCGLLLVDASLSAAVMEKYRLACGRSGTPLRVLPPGLLGEATGRPGKAMAIQPGGLAGELAKHCTTDDQPQGAAKDSGGAIAE